MKKINEYVSDPLTWWSIIFIGFLAVLYVESWHITWVENNPATVNIISALLGFLLASYGAPKYLEFIRNKKERRGEKRLLYRIVIALINPSLQMRINLGKQKKGV